jgi:hypothetical protein
MTHSEKHTRVSFDEHWDWFRACANESLRSLHSGNSDVDSLIVSQSAITEIDCKVSEKNDPDWFHALIIIASAYMISGTPPSALASHAIVSVLSPDSDDSVQ